ncbi:MAG: hypothetical protein R3D53_08920 [Paracoccaceae bacterium]
MPALPVTWTQAVSTAAIRGGPAWWKWAGEGDIGRVVDAVDLGNAETLHHARRTIILAAAALFSSAGWNRSATVPAKLRVSARVFHGLSSIAVCPSWPQACILPATREAGRACRLWMGSASIGTG